MKTTSRHSFRAFTLREMLVSPVLLVVVEVLHRRS
jgi:hypothetical protein